jgi:hypothetical protein
MTLRLFLPCHSVQIEKSLRRKSPDLGAHYHTLSGGRIRTSVWWNQNRLITIARSTAILNFHAKFSR